MWNRQQFDGHMNESSDLNSSVCEVRRRNYYTRLSRVSKMVRVHKPAQSRSYPANCNQSRLYPLCLLIVAGILLSGCAGVTQEQSEGVIAEREKIEKAYQKL